MEAANHFARRLSDADIRAFLVRLGERHDRPATLFLLGGGALSLLGNPRPTIDLDYLGSDLPAQWDEFQNTLRQLADEMHMEVEALPFQEFIPLPNDADQRHILIGQFGRIAVYVFDPYSIALSKIERGFESDLEDVNFLLRSNVIESTRLMQLAQAMIGRAKEFALDISQIRAHLDALARMV